MPLKHGRSEHNRHGVLMRKYQDHERPHACCYDCGLPYDSPRWADVVVSDSDWELINPTYHHGAGLLCFNCMVGRFTELGIINVLFKVTSGPFA